MSVDYELSNHYTLNSISTGGFVNKKIMKTKSNSCHSMKHE